MGETIQRVEVRGRLDELRFPDLCAHCATPTSEHLYVEKPVDDSETTGYGAEGVEVPFCFSCIEAHQMEIMEIVPLTEAQIRRRILLERLPDLLFFMWFVWLMRPLERVVFAPVLLLFLLCIRGASDCERRRRSVPVATSVTSAFDFSPERFRSQGASRTYTMRHPIFASAFMTANEGCRLDPPSKLRRAVTCVTQYAVLLAQCALVIWVIWSFTQMRMQR